VAAVQLSQPVAGALAEPGEERQRPPAEILLEASRCIGERLLSDVGWIHTGRQPPIKSDGDELSQPGSMPLQEPLPCIVVASGGGLE